MTRKILVRKKPNDSKPLTLAEWEYMVPSSTRISGILSKRISAALESREELLEVCKYLVNSFPGNEVAQLGNGKARRAYDLARNAIQKAEAAP